MPAGQDIEVVISGNNIEVNVNPTATFSGVDNFMEMVNTAHRECIHLRFNR